MNRKSTSMYVENTIGLLVEHFGVSRVQAALAKVSNGAANTFSAQGHRRTSKSTHELNLSLASMLEQLQQSDQEKHRLLADFYTRLKDKTLLPESQDIHHFAQIIGLKDITGKSRKDMIPKLMRFLVDRPNDRLRAEIETAATVSEHQRKQGFSILTDKILGGTADPRLVVRNQ